MKKVLVVEDEKSLNEAYRTILKRYGYDVASATDGEEALEAVKSYEPHVILLDLRMPIMDGLEFLRRFKKAKGDKPKKKTGIIVLSNLDTQSEIDEAFSLGAERYILKAWAAPQDLAKVVEEAFEDLGPVKE